MCHVSVGRQESAQIEAPANHCLTSGKPAGYLQRSKSGTLVTVSTLLLRPAQALLSVAQPQLRLLTHRSRYTPM